MATGNELAVAEASPPAMSVRVSTGKAFIGGLEMDEARIDAPIAAVSEHANRMRLHVRHHDPGVRPTQGVT